VRWARVSARRSSSAVDELRRANELIATVRARESVYVRPVRVCCVERNPRPTGLITDGANTPFVLTLSGTRVDRSE